jgi:DNA-binding transcriptional ArsR family regulator
MDTEEAVGVLQALAQTTRLEILRLLVQVGADGMAAGEIARRLGVPAPTLSFHLKAMQQAKLVSSERNGRSLVYRAGFPRLGEVVGFLTENCCAGAPPIAPEDSVGEAEEENSLTG